MVFRKPNFGAPPEGYIAGLGRGAVGFITRGDIGTARIGESTFGGMQLNAPPGLSRPPGLKPDSSETAETNFDEWSGYGGALFAGIKEDLEDKEAEAAYAGVETYMNGRRARKTEEKAQQLKKTFVDDTSDIKSKFIDVKRKLADVSREEWEALPEAQDLVKQNKKRKLGEKQRYTPVPDSVLGGATGIFN